MRTLGDKIAETDKKLKEVEQGLRDIMLTIPNMPDASVPVGKDDTETRKSVNGVNRRTLI